MVSQAAVLFFPALMAFAAASDLVTMTISNKISLALLAGFLVLAPLAGFGWAEIALSLGLAFAVLGATFGMFAMGWIGGGDAKLAAAAVLWMGPSCALAFGLYAALFGGALSLAFISFRRLPLPAFAAREEWVARLHAPTTGIPYGVALAAGALVAFPQTAWFAGA
ncbi:A24 family peptidase [Methylobrevis pamukkalensis]|uniref:Type IV leader peptidase family protein n=1 Tax=Methylobrevis pamukkalensis TaxID=1439726 RepID=A0A1E3H3L2_9HYPH|nr:prepilin peptidase [Methylobrevis pamukkalensis]ODN70908.1 Type IV leader peptidase family protein [Methylobrevis pamukkalensis]